MITYDEGRVLDADRPDLDLVTIVFQDDAVDLGGQLSLVGFTEVEVRRPWQRRESRHSRAAALGPEADAASLIRSPYQHANSTDLSRRHWRMIFQRVGQRPQQEQHDRQVQQ